MTRHREFEIDKQTADFIDGPVPLLIGGERRQASDGGTFTTYDPTTGESVASVAKATQDDVEDAVRAVRASFDSRIWRDATPAEREDVLSRCAGLAEEHTRPLGELDCLDTGMPIGAALAAVPRAKQHFRYFAKWATKLQGDTIPVSPDDTWLNYTKHEPVGVVAAIIPWDTPIDNAVWKLAAPLAAGCSVILKPAELTPLSALYLAELLYEAGLPEGVLSVCRALGTSAPPWRVTTTLTRWPSRVRPRSVARSFGPPREI